jgi:hypothetical protein
MLRPYKSNREGNMTLKHKKCRPMNPSGEGEQSLFWKFLALRERDLG